MNTEFELTPGEITDKENEFFDLYDDLLEYGNSLSPKDHPKNPLSFDDYDDGKIIWLLQAQVAKVLSLLEPSEIIKRLEQAVYDNRGNKPLDLTEQEYELFYMIFNDGAAIFEPVELESLGEHELAEAIKSTPLLDAKTKTKLDIEDLRIIAKQVRMMIQSVSQATIAHNQEKFGTLYRVKEE